MKTSKGYTLLFAVIVSVLLLSIAAFILSVSRKQFILSSSARDSIYAFYAADSGLECAMENFANLATSTFTGNVMCGGNSFVATNIINAGAGTSTFAMFTGSGTRLSSEQTQSGVASCATITFSQYIDSSGGLITNIISRGNNIGWKTSTSDCSTAGPRKVERALQYTQFQ